MPDTDNSVEPFVFRPSPIEWAFPRSPAEVRAAIIHALKDAGARRKPGKILPAAAQFLDLTRDELRLPLSESQLANVHLSWAHRGQWRLALCLALSSLLRAEIVDRTSMGYQLATEHYGLQTSDIESNVKMLPNDIGWDLTIAELGNLILNRMHADQSFQPTENPSAIRMMITNHAASAPDEQYDTPTPFHHAVLLPNSRNARSETHCSYLERTCIDNLQELHLLPSSEGVPPSSPNRDTHQSYEHAVAKYLASATVNPPVPDQAQTLPRSVSVKVDHRGMRARGRKSLANVSSPKLISELTDAAASAMAEVRQWIAEDDSVDALPDAQLEAAIPNTCFEFVRQASAPLSLDAIRDGAKGFRLAVLEKSRRSLLDQPLTRGQIASVQSGHRDDNQWEKGTYDAIRALVAIDAIEQLETQEFVIKSSWLQRTPDDVESKLDALRRRQRTVPLTVLEIQHAVLRVLQMWKSARPSRKPSYMQLFAVIEDGYAATVRPGDLLDAPMTSEQRALLDLPWPVIATQTQVGQLFHVALTDLCNFGLVDARPDDRALLFREFMSASTSTDITTVEGTITAMSDDRAADPAASSPTADQIAIGVLDATSGNPLPFSTIIDIQRQLLPDLADDEGFAPDERNGFHEQLYEEIRRLTVRNFVQLAPHTGIGISTAARGLKREDAVSLIRSGRMPSHNFTIRYAPMPDRWQVECIDALAKVYPEWLKRDEIAELIANTLDLNQHQRAVPTNRLGLEYRNRVGVVLGALRELNLVRRRNSGNSSLQQPKWREWRISDDPNDVRPAELLNAIAKLLSDERSESPNAAYLQRGANEMLEHLATPNSGLPSDADLAVAVLEVLKTNGERQRLPAICKGVARRLSVPAPVAEQDGPPWIGWDGKPLARTTKSFSLLEYRINLALDVMRQFGWVGEKSADGPNPWTITEVGVGVAPEHVARRLADNWQFRRRSLEHWKLEPWMTDWYNRMVPLGGDAFELLCADILSWDSRFDVRVRIGSRDGGLDIEIRDDRQRRRHFAQCKGWVGEQKVNHKVVREMPGAVSDETLRENARVRAELASQTSVVSDETRQENDEGYDAGYAIIMTSGELTSDLHDEGAWQFADSHFDGFIVVDGKRLLELVRQTGIGIIVRSHDDIVVDEGYFDELAERARELAERARKKTDR